MYLEEQTNRMYFNYVIVCAKFMQIMELIKVCRAHINHVKLFFFPHYPPWYEAIFSHGVTEEER